jgi:hypothetical protein
MAYIDLETLEYPLSERDIRSANPDTSFGIPFAPDGYAVVFPYPTPSFDQYTQYVREIEPELTVKGHWEQRFEVIDLAAEELQISLARKVVDEAKANEVRVASLWQAAHDYEYKQISGSAVGLLTLGIINSKPKCVAVQDWIQAIWTEYYTRKANGSSNFDFSTVGECPFTIPELMEELSY